MFSGEWTPAHLIIFLHHAIAVGRGGLSARICWQPLDISVKQVEEGMGAREAGAGGGGAGGAHPLSAQR